MRVTQRRYSSLRCNDGLSRAILFLLFVIATHAVDAAAPSFPTKPVRMIVPTTPGGPADALAREFAQRLPQIWGQQVIVDNRPGGHGVIGMGMLANAAPDGHTLLMGNIGIIAINAGLYSKLPYDTVRDFAPVMLTTKQPFLLGINAGIPANDLKTFIALVKAKPGQMHYGSAGNGSGTHVSMEMLKRKVGMDLVHVPYKGGGPVLIDLMGAQVQAFMSGVFTLMPGIRSGKLRGLAVSHPKRISIAPDIPTFAEAGVADFEVSQWQGMLAPAKLPPHLMAKIHADIARVMRAPEIDDRMTREGLEIVVSKPEEFAAFIQTEIARWRKVIKEAGIRID